MARKFLDGIQIPIAPTTGFVLTSDSVGVGTWQAPSAGGSGGILDCGSPTTTYAGNPHIDLGGVT